MPETQMDRNRKVQEACELLRKMFLENPTRTWTVPEIKQSALAVGTSTDDEINAAMLALMAEGELTRNDVQFYVYEPAANS